MVIQLLGFQPLEQNALQYANFRNEIFVEVEEQLQAVFIFTMFMAVSLRMWRALRS